MEQSELAKKLNYSNLFTAFLFKDIIQLKFIAVIINIDSNNYDYLSDIDHTNVD